MKALETSFDIARGEAYASAVIATGLGQRFEAVVRAETLHSQPPCSESAARGKYELDLASAVVQLCASGTPLQTRKSRLSTDKGLVNPVDNFTIV